MSQQPYDPYDRNAQTLEIQPRPSHQYEQYVDSPAHPLTPTGWGQYPPPPPSPTVRNSVQASSFEERMPLKTANEGSALAKYSTKAGRDNGRKKWIWLGIAVAILLIAAAVVIPVYFVVIKKSNGDGSSSGGSDGEPKPDGDGNPDTNAPPPAPRAITGGGGSEVTREDGSKFIYKNDFGGFWVQDPNDPYNLGARPNDFTPPLNTTWRWGVDRVYGVNLGGLYVIEPFITPHFFQKYEGAEDEFMLMERMRAAGNLAELDEHYETFITEDDIAEIAGAGLNWLRVPLGFWAVETYENEPFVERKSWLHFVKLVEWARKYGLRIFLDMHALPGGQNSLNHSGRRGHFSFLNGPMGLANAQRMLYYLRVITEFISQPEIQPVVPMLGLVNEPRVTSATIPLWRSWYLEAYRVIREAGGYGEGKGPYIVIGDGFRGFDAWAGVMPGADRFVMDRHPYMAFDMEYQIRPQVPTEMAADGKPGGIYPAMACERWANEFNNARANIGVTVGGEFSTAINDCGLFMRGVGLTNNNPACAPHNAWENWSPAWKEGLLNFILASYDAIGDFFYWTWKIGPSQAGRVETPMWSYKLGLEHGWMPKDPRAALGKCRDLGFGVTPFTNYRPWQTGGVAQPTIDAGYVASHPWPPAVIPEANVPVSLMPTYTTTGPAITLPPHTFSGAPAEKTQHVDGWANDADTAPGVGPIPGCSYPDQYTVTALVPAPTGPWCA